MHFTKEETLALICEGYEAQYISDLRLGDLLAIRHAHTLDEPIQKFRVTRISTTKDTFIFIGITPIGLPVHSSFDKVNPCFIKRG